MAPKQGWIKTVTRAFAPDKKRPIGKTLYIDAPTIEDVRRELNWMVIADAAFPKGTIFLTRRIAWPAKAGTPY